MADPELPEQLPSVGELQFRRAQPVSGVEAPAERSCAACKQLIAGEYYQVQNHVICPQCAEKIRAGQQAQRPVPWLRFVIYGIVALAVGWMVGKAIRAGAYGTGGRAQQMVAVALTYFAISTSFLPAAYFVHLKHAEAARSTTKSEQAPAVVQDRVTTTRESISPEKMITGLLVFMVISPFLELKSSPAGGLISLFIIFIGLQRAWALTAKHEIMVSGPYS